MWRRSWNRIAGTSSLAILRSKRLERFSGLCDVGGVQLLSAFGRDLMEVADYDLAFATRQLQDAGMEIARAEDAATPVTFFDIGAVAYFLRAVPWVVPNFDVGQDREVLAHLHEQIDLEGNYVVDGSHLLIEARRP